MPAKEALTLARRDHREAQRIETRERLLEVSVAEFQRNGFGNTDIASIAERAGVSRGTFYFHFPTKDEVLAELRMREELRIVQEVAPRLEKAPSLAEVLRAVVAGVLATEAQLGTELVREICAVQFRPGTVRTDTPDQHPLAQFVLDVFARPPGSAPPVKPQQRADQAVLFLIGLFGLLATQRGPSKERDHLIDALVTLTVKGVVTP